MRVALRRDGAVMSLLWPGFGRDPGLPAQAQPTQPSCGHRSSLPFTPTGPKTLYNTWVDSVARNGPRPCIGRRAGAAYEYLSFDVSGSGGRVGGGGCRACAERGLGGSREAERQRACPTPCDEPSLCTAHPYPTAPLACLPSCLKQEAGELAADVGSAMVHVGLAPHARAAVYGANSPEWMLTMQVGVAGGESPWADGASPALVLRRRYAPLAVLGASAALGYNYPAVSAVWPTGLPCRVPLRRPAGVQPAQRVLRAAVRCAGGQHSGVHH